MYMCYKSCFELKGREIEGKIQRISISNLQRQKKNKKNKKGKDSFYLRWP